MNKSIKLNDKIINDSLPVSTRPYSLKSIFFSNRIELRYYLQRHAATSFASLSFPLTLFYTYSFQVHTFQVHTHFTSALSVFFYSPTNPTQFFSKKGRNTQIWIGRVCPFYTLSRKAKKIWL